MIPPVLAFPFLVLASTVGEPAAPAPAAAQPGGSSWRIEGDQAGAQLGSSLATADVNGDGYGDLVVGAPGWDDIFPGEGRVTLHLGSPAGLSAAPAWTRYGRQRGAHFGAKIACAGDVNNDGYDDIVVGAPDFDVLWVPGSLYGTPHPHRRLRIDQGRVQVYLGSPTGLSNPQRAVNGIEMSEYFGSAVAGAGDVNGDGHDDILVGAIGKGGGVGALFLFAGTAAGIPASPAWIHLGSGTGTGLGSVIAAAGDVDADGFADFLSSAPGSGSSGVVSLFLGSPSGPGSAPDQTFDERASALGGSGDLDQDGLVEQLYVAGNEVRWREFSLPGTATGTFPILGQPSRVAAGDFDDDGRTDIAASSPAFEQGPFRGRVFAYMNRPGASFSPSAAFPVYDGDQAGAGWGEALAAIDVDGDGADELFVGAPRQEDGEPGEGAVSMFPGWPAKLEMAERPRVYSSGTSGIGDFDGDGFSDLLTVDAEQVRLRYGAPSGLPAAIDATLTLPPLAFHNLLFVGFSAGDVNGDGFDDAQLTFNAQNAVHGGYLVDAIRHSLYLGGAGGLTRSPAMTIDGGSSGEAELVGDVNADGYDDMIVSRNDAEDQLYLGTSSLPVQAQTLLPATPHQSSDTFGQERHRAILPGDVNGDAYGDVVLVRLDTTGYYDYVEFYRGSPGGLVLRQNWRPATALHPLGFSAPYSSFVALEDLDGDGLDDLVIQAEDEDEYACFRGSPAGFARAAQWWEPASSSSPFWFNHVLALSDLDGDGYADLLLQGDRLHRGSASGISRAPAWSGASLSLYDSGGVGKRADFDGDGLMEFLVGSTSSVRIFEVIQR